MIEYINLIIKMKKKEIKKLTEQEMKNWPKKIIVDLEEPYTDERGTIQPIVDTMMQSAVMINSKKGSIRANHYHKTDWHYCYVLEGLIEYFHRTTGSEEEPKKIMVKKGEMVFTPPLVDHAIKFPIDTTFLTLSRNPRDQDTYERDVVRIDMIDTDGLLSWKPKI